MADGNLTLLSSSIKLFNYYRSLGQKTMDQCTDEMLHVRQHPEDNSIATIVKHLHGNMLSRWTDFLTSDGEKEWRKRDDEFVTDQESREVIQRWFDEGWDCVMSALEPLQENQASQIVYIRSEGNTVIEAIQRQLGHYAYHTGQIVMLGKSLRGAEWTSLSIPKGDSGAYNAKKDAEGKGRRHFTDKI